MKNADMPAMPIGLTVGPMGDVYGADFSETGLTKREQFCLKMGVAETGDKDLDDVIRKGNKQKFAVMAMKSLIPVYFELDMMSKYESADALVKCLMESSVEHADALLKELENDR